MARRKAGGTSKAASSRKKTGTAPARKSAKKAAARSTSTRKTAAKKASAAGRRAAAAPKSGSRKKAVTARKAAAAPNARSPKLARSGKRPAPKKGGRGAREEEMVPSPPSSLNMNRRGSAARTGRAEIAEERAEHATMTPAITGGDVDADVENAYFSGDEAPGGDNPTPDQDIVDDIGRALGVEYQDNEELRASDKVTARDKHRWELDPASAEDYKERK
jgi:hypothetical protein